MLANIVDMLVNLVGQYKQVFVLQDDICQSLQLSLAVHASCWVAGRAEDNESCLWCDSCLELLGGHLEVLVETCFYEYRFTASQKCHLWVANPVWGGDDNLLAIVNQRHYCVAHTLLGTVAHQNLVDGIVKLVLVLKLSYNGLAQIGIAWNW